MFLRSVAGPKLAQNYRLASTATSNLPLQLTVAIVKPHAVAQPGIIEVSLLSCWDCVCMLSIDWLIEWMPIFSLVFQDIEDELNRDGFIIVRSKTVRLTRKNAAEFYKEHFGRCWSAGRVLRELISSAEQFRCSCGELYFFLRFFTPENFLRYIDQRKSNSASLFPFGCFQESSTFREQLSSCQGESWFVALL